MTEKINKGIAPKQYSRMDSGAAGAENELQNGSQSLTDFPGPANVVQIKGIRKIIAERMRESLLNSAQLTLHTSASAEKLLGVRNAYKGAQIDQNFAEMSLNLLIMFSILHTLKKHPELNATVSEGAINQYQHVHLGFAVDTQRGLMVPVVRFADTLSIVELSREVRRLASACREGKVSPDDFTGGTFTVTNLGKHSVESFTPILNTPQIAILGVGTLVNAIADSSDEIRIEKRLNLSLTIDHQAVDGAPGARFLTDLVADLENLDEWISS